DMSAPKPARRRSDAQASTRAAPAKAGPLLNLTGGSTPLPPPEQAALSPRTAPPRLKLADPEALTTIEQLFANFQQLEAQLQQVRESLTHSHRLATLGTIASIIAHEYNNILTPVVSYAQLALAKPGDQELMKKAVEKALAGAERAAHISSSLLGFAREADQRHAAPLRRTIDET